MDLKSGVLTVGQSADRALGQRELGIAQQRSGVRAGLRAESFAGGAPAERTIERETVRRESLEAAAALVAGIVLAVNLGAPLGFGHVVFGIGDVHHALAERQRRFDGLGDAAAGFGLNAHAIDDDFDQVLAAAIDLRRLVDRVRLAVDAHPDVTQ